MSKPLLNRRQFGARCAAFGLSLPALSALIAEQALAQAAGAVAASKVRTVKLPDGTAVPSLGIGCWHLGQGRHPVAIEEEALNAGISLGMTLLDTSGNYGNGRSEEFLSHVLASQRERIFLVSKVEINEVADDGIARACAASLARLGSEPDGRSLQGSKWQSLRHQSGPIQSQPSQQRARCLAMVQAAQPTGHGLLAARRRQ